MKKRLVLYIILFCSLAGLFLACAATQERWAHLILHPKEEGENLRFCTECHDEADENLHYRRFVHTPLFMENHKAAARQNSNVCYMCHKQSSCGDCHAARVEMKPSIKDQTGTYRRTPHRGDYISRHKIDARVNPLSCQRCHGNPKTVQSCRTCHGK